MSTIEYVDHVQKGLDRLPSVWDDKPYALGFMRANLEVLQEIEDILHQLNDERDLDTAIGKQLDVLGALLNTPRAGLLDPEYREVLKAKTALSNASGTSPDIKNSVRLLTGASVVHTIPHYPAATYVFANSLITYRQGLAIQEAAAAGVRVRPIWYNGDDYFVPASKHLFGEFTLTDESGDPILVEDGTGEYELIVEVENTEGTLGGFTSLIPSAVGYQVVDDRGKFASVLPMDNESVATGYIIDHEGNYLVDDRNRFIAWRTDDPNGISPPVIPAAPSMDVTDVTYWTYSSDFGGGWSAPNSNWEMFLYPSSSLTPITTGVNANWAVGERPSSVEIDIEFDSSFSASADVGIDVDIRIMGTGAPSIQTVIATPSTTSTLTFDTSGMTGDITSIAVLSGGFDAYPMLINRIEFFD